MADINSSLPVRTETDGDVVAQITDGTDTLLIDGSGNANVILAANSGVDIGDVDVTSIIPGTGATNLGKAEDAVHASGDTGVMALAVRQDTQSDFGADGDYVPLSIDADGKLRTDASVTVNSEYAEDSAHTSTDTGSFVLAVRNDTLAALALTDGDYAPFQVDASGALYIQEGSALDVSAATVTVTDDGSFTLAANSGVDIGDVDVLSLPDVTQSTHDNLQANVNLQVADTDVAETNPVPVSVVGDVLGTEINDYNTTAAVGASSSDNHDVTITASTTFRLKKVLASASGKLKVEVQVGPVASLATKAVGFNSTSNPNVELTFDPPIEVDDASTGTIRVIRTNLEGSAQDVYSTILGQEIAD